MATSGTVGQLNVDAATFIDHAFLMCGKMPATVSGELMLRAREKLHFLLWALANDGVNLWCIKKTVFNLQPNRQVIPMATGTVDVINTLFRTLNAQIGTPYVAGTDRQGVVLAAAQVVRNVSGTFSAAGTATLVVQASVDGVTWESLATLNPVTVEAGSAFAIDIDNSSLAQWWQLKDTSGTLIPVTELAFRTISNEIPCSKLNRDDYQQLPNKTFTGQQALQFWFDKQINSQLWIWPMPSVAGSQLVVWEHSLIQDIGSLTNQLAVPMRWYEAIISALAVRVAQIIPPVELPPGKLTELKVQEREDRVRANSGESDGSSYRLAPNIRAYTR